METEKFNNIDLENRFAQRFSKMDEKQLSTEIKEIEKALEADHSKDIDWDDSIESQLRLKLKMANEALAVYSLINPPDAIHG